MVAGAETQKPPPARVVNAEAIVLHDDRGRPRMTLCGGDESTGGGPLIAMLDTTGTVRLQVSANMTDGNPAIVLRDQRGATLLRCCLADGGGRPGASLTILDGRGKPRVALGLGAGGQGGITLLDEAGRERVLLALQRDGSPAMAFFDEGGEPIPAAMLPDTLMAVHKLLKNLLHATDENPDRKEAP